MAVLRPVHSILLQSRIFLDLMLPTAGPIQEEIGSDVIYSQARSRRTRTNGPTRSFTFQDLPGVPVWCREAWTRTWNYTGLERNPYRLPVPVKALVYSIFD